MKNKSKTYIPCLGIDRKIHICEPGSKITKCGITVINTKVNNSQYFSCYECTY